MGFCCGNGKWSTARRLARSKLSACVPRLWYGSDHGLVGSRLLHVVVNLAIFRYSSVNTIRSICIEGWNDPLLAAYLGQMCSICPRSSVECLVRWAVTFSSASGAYGRVGSVYQRYLSCPRVASRHPPLSPICSFTIYYCTIVYCTIPQRC